MTQPFDWIVTRDPAQLEWIASYLARKIFKGSTAFISVKPPAEYGYVEMAKSLKKLPDEAEYREASRQMKGAWNTYQYRKKNGNPVSLQIPEKKIKQLKLLAKKRKKSQAQTLSDLINEALGKKNFIAKETSNLSDSFLDVAQQYIHQSDVDSLIDELMNEINHRCYLEVLKNAGDPVKDFSVRAIYFHSVRERITELATKISIMQSRDGSVNSTILEKALEKSSRHGFNHY